MEITQTSQDRDLVIVGLAVRTAPQRAAADIPAHWQRFFSEQISARLTPLASDPSLYCVYCDYDTDFRGAYTMLLGHALAPDAVVPEGLRRVRVPAGSYARFSFAGHPQQAINGAWQYANERWAGRQRRRYIADYECYAPGAMTPDHVAGFVAIGVD